jgi:hypothetical protein
MSNLDDIDRQERKKLLNRLELEHAALDQDVALLTCSPGADQLTISRMKRRKLQLKDMIAQLRSSLLPDFIA